jgi:hypothetical protein
MNGVYVSNIGNVNARGTMLDGAKSFGHKILPTRVYRRVHTILHWILAFGIGLRFVATSGVPRMLICFGTNPGDNLLCTAVLRELRKRNRGKLGMISNFPELFEVTNDAMSVSPLWGDLYRKFARIWRRDFRVVHYLVGEAEDRIIPPKRHIIAELCARAGILGPVAVRPYLLLTDNEKTLTAWAKGCIAIQSSGLDSTFPVRNKQWYPERFQAVVNALHREFDFIQLGSAADPTLENVKDLRGATSIRESAAILHHTRLYVGNVGFLMHLARAVECPSVIVYGGREAPGQSGYICNANLYTALPCAPCWRFNTCDFDRMCMKEIKVEDVIFEIRELMRKPRNPLAIETTVI